MFASVWQLLTAIFVFSALTKLVYKLIKQEDPRANSHSSFRGQGAAGRRAQQQQQLNQQQLDRQGGEEWYNLVHLNQQQQQQLFAPNLGLGPVGGGGGQPDEFLATPSDQDGEESSEEEEPQVQELTDEDDEFEEALSQVFSGQASSPLSREREQEERRLRWLTRQQFRRQLHRLSNSAAASSLDLTSRRSASSSEYLDACSSSSSSSSRVSLNLPQQQVVASRAHDKNNGNTQQATTNKQTLWPGQGNTAPAAAAAGGCTSSSERFVVNQSEVSSASSSSSSLHANIRENTQQQNAQFKKRASSHLLHLSNLSQLIAEVFLVEPIKLTCTIVRQTFKHFCAFLDFIEGIEAPLTEEQLVGTGPRSTGSGGRGPIATGGRGLGNPTTSKLASTSRIGNFQHNQAQRTSGDSHTPATTTKRSHPNYFHRRYFSQRSLSAALLSDNPDRQQQGGPTRPLV